MCRGAAADPFPTKVRIIFKEFRLRKIKSIQNRAGKCPGLPSLNFLDPPPGGGGTWVIFGWVCAARDSKLTPRSKKISVKIDTPF